MTEVESATFSYSEDGPGEYTFMALRLEETHSIMRSAGWRDGHVIFLKVDGDVTDGSHDPFKLAPKIAAADDDILLKLLIDIREGGISFEEIDGKVFHQGEVDYYK